REALLHVLQVVQADAHDLARLAWSEARRGWIVALARHAAAAPWGGGQAVQMIPPIETVAGGAGDEGPDQSIGGAARPPQTRASSPRCRSVSFNAGRRQSSPRVTCSYLRRGAKKWRHPSARVAEPRGSTGCDGTSRSRPGGSVSQALSETGRLSHQLSR